LAEYASRVFEIAAKGREPEIRLELRSCRPEDAETYLPFWKAIASETTHTLQRLADGLPDVEKVRANWKKTLEDPRAMKLGVFREGALIAQLGIYAGPPHPWTDHILVFGMMVRREFWGRGIGSLLLEELENYARSLGVTKIEAQVRVENDRGWSLYERHGYRIEGRRTRAANIDGRYVDEYWIAKDLGA